MTRPNPIDRPRAVEALALWKELRGTVWAINREWRPRPRREHPVEMIFLDSISMRNFFCSLPTML